MEVFKRKYQKKTLIISALCILACASFAYGQIRTVDTFVIETLHVFPDTIETNSWSNVETIVNQNLADHTLYQDFGRLNSAYLKESAKPGAEKIVRNQDADAAESSVDVVLATSSDQLTDGDSGSENAATTTAATTTENVISVSTSTSETENTESLTASSTPKIDSLVPTSTILQWPISLTTSTEQTVASTSAVDVVASTTASSTGVESSRASTSSSTAFETLQRGFSYVFETFTKRLPFVQNSTTTDLASVDAESDEGQGDEDGVSTPATSTDDVSNQVSTENEEATSTTTESVIDNGAIASSTSEASEINLDTNTGSTTIPATTASTTASTTLDTETDSGQFENESTNKDEDDSVDRVESDDVSPAATTSQRYHITLSGFDLPLFTSDELALDGGQVRVSMAAKKRTFRLDESARFVMEYSFNDGNSWETGGEVVIDDEISNSINGGYYLFALPTLEDPEVLGSLKVRLVYEGLRSTLDEFYIDSAWLELFTVTKESGEEVGIENFDDNFTEAPLSGDLLELSDGEIISFDFTDENEGETLIIKSNDVSYEGLSEATMYFSVTNTSASSDQFSLKTYFPKDVGTVTGLEEWNQNKPRTITIPEYRPYVYHCEAGWEILEDQDNDTELIPDIDIFESQEASTTEVLLQSENPATSSTTTIQSRLETSAVFMQAATSSSATTSIQVPEVEPEAVQYTCRQTNIVRTCDALDGDETACHQNAVKVQEHTKTYYSGGWQSFAVDKNIERTNTSRLAKLGSLLGVTPSTKVVPDRFQARAGTEDTFFIRSGETKYFKMDIAFPLLSSGEFWIEAVGSREYGLLDPFWSSDWTYRMPILIDNTAGTEALTEHQVFLELDSTLGDFWTNVASDGSDIRFIQESAAGNLFPATTSQYDNAYSNDWNGRIAITIASSSVFDTVTNFPVFIDLASLGSDFWSNVQTDGDDIRITQADGATEVPYDLVEIDTVAETGELHFLAPRLDANDGAVFHIYYDNPSAAGYAATDTYGSEAVWVDYEAVYHFSDDPTSVSNTVLDATANSNDLTVTTDALATTSGAMGTALDMTVSGTGYLSNTTWNWVTGEDIVSMGLYQQSANSAEAIWQWGTNNNPNWMSYMPWYSNAAATGRGYLYHGRNANTTWDRTSIVNQWTHFTTVSGTTIGDQHVIYEQAVQQLTNTQSVTDPSNADDLQIGRYTTAGSYNGYIDELRFVADQAPYDAEWVATEHLNQTAPDTFYATSTNFIGGTATLGWYSTSWNNRQKITIPASENISDFPVYVDLSTLGDDFFTDVASDGRDIRVISEDGQTEYPYELVAIDTGAKTGELYFKASLSSSADTVVYLYYNNEDATAYARDDVYGSENVWTNNFVAVYHFEEDAAGTGNADVYRDSTENEYHGDDETTSNDTTGYLGSGVELGDDANDRIVLPKEVLDGATNITTTWWHNSNILTDQSILSGANSGQFNEYWLRLDNSTRLIMYAQGGAETTTLDSGATYNDGTWQHYVAVSDFDNDQMNVYRNGVGDTENPDPQTIATTSIDTGGLIIGQDQDSVGGGFSDAENFDGQLDELRVASVVRDSVWAETEYANQNSPETFYATSSAESLTTTVFSELDFWVQHFDSSADEMDVWLQVDAVPAGSMATIWLYYGNGAATSASNPLTPFTYSTTTDLFYVVDDNATANEVSVVSLIDNNEVAIDGGATVPLDEGERTTFSTFDGTSVISALGPISGTVQSTGNDSSDSILPISFASTSFAIPTNRSTNRTYVYAPFASTSVSSYVGSSGTADQTQSIATSAVATFTADPADSGNGTDGDGIVIESTSPVLVLHRTTNPGDGLAMYPPTTRDLYGFDSQYLYMSALAASSDPDYECSGGTAGGTETGITRGEKDFMGSCSSGTQSNADAVRFTGAASPISAIQQADSDGNESSVFWPQHEFGTRYAVPNDAQYIAVTCAPRHGTATLEIYDPGGVPSGTTASCEPTSTKPGKVYFGSTASGLQFAEGTQVVSTNDVGFFAIHEDMAGEANGDEKNMNGPVQARKYGNTFDLLFGEQELAVDADYEQLSFLWYQNTDALSPTTTWAVGDSNVSEGDVITGQGAINNGDVLRLRMNLRANNATGTEDSVAFKLQYATANSGQCNLATNWEDVGGIGSTTADFAGYENASVSDGTILATSTLASTTQLATYEERNLSDLLPFDLGVNEVAEWDWVLTAVDVGINDNYCFRMVRNTGNTLSTYTTYPELETSGPPQTPTLLTYFDNEKTGTLDSELTFFATDVAGDDIHYRVQIDNDRDFSSPTVDRNSTANFLEFENLNTPSDKAPFNNGEPIQFNSPTTLASSTTYWWRVQASDPDGSATSSDWSTPYSFTTDTSVTVSEWFQTTGYQFETNTLTNMSTSTNQVTMSVSPGQIISSTIDYDDATVGNAWGSISWNDTETSGTILYTVEYNDNGVWTVVPDSDLPGNSSGTTTSPINILGLDTDTYNEIRIVADFVGTTLSLQDWTVTWGQRVETPVLGDPFDNQQTPDTLPVFDFISSDPQSDDLEYEISWSTDYTFITSSTTKNSGVDIGFYNAADATSTSPFTSGDTITYTVQPADELSNATTYWWRARAKDPLGGDAWSPWSEQDSFTVATSTTVSTWHQTTRDQFFQGNLLSTVASTSNSVEVVSDVGEYGQIELLNENWTEVTTNIEYNSMIVVASARYSPQGETQRSVRVRNKTSDTFEIKVDDPGGTLAASTTVDYMVMEEGVWTLNDGAGGTQVIAGTLLVDDVQGAGGYATSGYGDDVDFIPDFTNPPVVIATVSTENDSSWVIPHLNDGNTRDNEPTADAMGLYLGRSNESAIHDPENIDYIAFERGHGTNNGGEFDADFGSDSHDEPPVTAENYNTAFSSAPNVIITMQGAEQGGNGAWMSIYDSTSPTATQYFPVSDESGDRNHTPERSLTISFENISGTLSAETTSGSITSEDIIFSDGTGPKFASFDWNETTPGSSEITYQVEYQVSENTYALIPDSNIPGNSVGTTSNPIDLTNVDVNIYDQIRLRANFVCNAGDCPDLNDWTVTWSEGVNMSGTLQAYDRSTNIATGTIRAAVNGSLVGGTGSVSAGTWTLNNVTAFAGDVITVWVDGAADEDEAVTVFVYDGLGDMTGVALYEQHLAIDADEIGTLTNTLLSSYDNSFSANEDIFFDVDGSNNLTVCATGSCADANLFIAAGQTYIAATTTPVTVTMHDLVNEGTIDLDANTFEIQGSWINSATSSVGAATIAMLAATGTESITDPSDPLAFNDLVFGFATSTASWTMTTSLDLSGDLSVLGGTFNRDVYDISLEGSLTTGASGTWSGTGTTTFDGSGIVTWSDAHATTSLQNVGNVTIDGASKFVALTGDVAAYDIVIGANDTLSSDSYVLQVGGDWNNNGTFLAGTSEVVIMPDDRTYPATILGSQDWYSDTDFDKRTPIVIQNAEVGADLTNFPVYVNLNSLGDDFWSNVQTDGDDIRITESDGQTELPIDVVHINTANETGEVHFLANTVYSATDTTFYIYHDNATATAYASGATYGSEAVWSGYEAVYHFQDDPTTISNIITDETGNGKDLAVTDDALATSSGKLGDALDLTVSATGILTDSDWTWTAGDRLESSGWYKQSAASSEAVWSWGTGTAFNLMPWYSGTARGYHRFGSAGGAFTFDFTPRDAVNWSHFTSLGATSTSEQNYTYIDTILRDSPTQAVANPTASGLQIGRYTTAGSIQAELDELRFATSSRSTDWIEAEYANQDTPDIFYATSSMETYVPDIVPDEATHTITTGGSAFYDITFNDATTTPAFSESSIVVSNDFIIATGTVALPVSKTTVGGSFINSGVFMHNNSELEFTSSASETITLDGTAFLNTLYDITFNGSGDWTFTDTNATTSNNFVIQNGSVDLPGGTLLIGGALTVSSGSFNDNGGIVVFSSTESQNITTNGSTFNDVQFGGATALPWVDSAWAQRTSVVVAPGVVGADLTNYPFYVDLSTLGNDFWSNVNEDGSDIRVTRSDGATQVPVDVVEISTGAKTGELHFLANSIASAATTTFYIYFDNADAVAPAASDPYGSEAVWSGYEAVYHFVDVASVPDETGNGRDLSTTVGTAVATSGLMGTALDTTSASVRLEDTDWTWTAGDDLISSGWYFQNAIDTGALWQFGQAAGSNNDSFLAFLPWYSNTTRGYHRFGQTSGDDYNFTRDNTRWHHFTTIGRATAGENNLIYEDNVLRDTLTQTVAGQNPTNGGLRIGAYQTTTYMDIQIDELRFATTTVTTDWIAAEYTNQYTPASFYATTTAEELADTVPNFTLNEATTDIDGTLIVDGARLVAPSSELTVGGSFTITDAIFDANNATTTFDSTSGSEVVTTAGSVFNNVSFNAVGGSWINVGDITVTDNASLVTGSQFTLATGTTMSVAGVFSNTFNAASTTWTDSTLVLTGGDYTVTDRLSSGDTYATVEVSDDTDIVMWNSSISTSTIGDTSSIYMPDFNGTDGLLRIYGDYERNSGTEYWSYATDFDGTDLTGGSERAVTVEIENGSQLVFGTSTTFEMLGTATATTSVSSLFGLYELTLIAATIEAQYFSVDGAGADGLSLQDGTTITTLSDGNFLISAGRTAITVDATTMNEQPSTEYINIDFASTTGTGIYGAAWSDQMIITILASAVESNLTNFPVYIDLSLLGADFWSGVASDGADIRMTTTGADELPIEVVNVDATAQTGELYFLAPSLSSTEDTNYYIHFNNPSAIAYADNDTYGAEAVWSGYEAVYHFSGDPAVVMVDSTQYGRDLTPSVGTAATTTGLVGTALDTTGNVMLFSGWTWPAGYDLISSGLYFQSVIDAGALWQFGDGGGSNNGTYLAFLPWYNNTTRGYHYFGITSGGDYNFTRDNSVWHHFTTIGRAADGADNEIYEDKVLRDTVTQITSSQNPTNTGLKIGRYQTGNYYDGQVDELRFATTTPTEAWMNTEYNNLKDNSNFFATSSQQTTRYNVTTEGAPSTYWLFSNGTGDHYGEAFDNDDGDPGSIQWDDSDYTITISGVVYQDDGNTPATAPVCNGSTPVVTVKIDGVATYSAPCEAIDGSYSVTGISYTGEPKITTYINSEATSSAVQVALYDELTATGTVSGGNMTITRPAVLDNSVLVAIIGKNDDPAITEPAGWTALDTLGNTTGDDLSTGIFYRVVADASSEPASYTFSADNEQYSYWIGSLLNVDTVTPVDVATSWTKYQDDNTPTASSTTSVTNGAFVLSAWYVIVDDDMTLPTFGWDVRAQNVVSANDNNLSVVSKSMPTAGATGDATAQNLVIGRESHAGQFVFRPASSETATGTMVATAVTQTPLGGGGAAYKEIAIRDQRTGFGTVAASPATIDVDAPSMSNGDVLVAIIGKEDEFTITAPAGWVKGDDLGETAGSDVYSGIWYKVITNAGGEPSSYSFINNDTGAEEYAYWIGAIDNVDTTNVFDVTPSWSNIQDTSAPAAPSVTTVTDGAYVLAAWAVMYDNVTTMPGGAWTTLADDLNVSSRMLSVAGQRFASAGATGAVVLADASTDDVNVGQFALRPEPASVTDSVIDMDLYQNRVIVRHEDVTPLAIDDMLTFTNVDDSDIPYTAATGTPDTLTILDDYGLVVWNNKTFISGGNILLAGNGSTTADGSLLINPDGTLTMSGTEQLTIGGSFYVDTAGTFTSPSTTINFTASSSGQQIGAGASSTITFNDIDFIGVGGGWAVQTPIVSLNDITVATGTVSGVSNITIADGSLSGDGLVNMSAGTVQIDRANTLGGAQAWTFNNLVLGNGVTSEVTTPASSATTTVDGVLTIATGHFLDAGSSVWDLGGSGSVFVENGTFLEDTSIVQYSGSGASILRTAYYDLVIDAATGTVTATAPTTGLQILNDLTVGSIATATLDIDANDPLVAVAGNVVIGAAGVIDASDSNTFEAYGSWNNDGVFTANGGLVELNAATGTVTVAAGNSSFADLSLLGGASFVFTESATATADMVISGVFGYTVNLGTTLAVGGTFTNDGDGSGSTWTDATLYLYGGQAYTINDKNDSDDYATLIVGTSTQPRMWNSSAATTTVLTDGSLYSMDHADVAGDLYIFGDYVNTSFDDYWQYNADWDGVDLGVATRTAAVYIEGGGSARYDAGSLSVIGSSTATTTIQNQGSGTYDLIVGGTASTSWQYAQPRDLTSAGLTFGGAPTIGLFDNLDFLVEINSAQAVTVGGTVIDANPAKNLDANIFNDDIGVTGAINVTATGTSVSSWRFTNHSGDIDGESFDNDGGDPGEIVWVDSAALITISGTIYNDEGSTVIGAPVCDGVTANITLVVAGLTSTSTTCDAVTGAYTFTNVGFGPADAIIVYINDGSSSGAAVTVDPISNINNMDVYEDRVIVRHESTDVIRIADLAVWDSSDDADIPFTAVDAGSDTLTLPADTKLIVWTNKTFEPGGDVTLSGGGAGAAHDGTLELYDDATYRALTTESHSVGGNMVLGSNAVLESASSTFTFTTGDSGRTIDVNNNAFHNVTFSGAGDITLTDSIFTAYGDVSITAGDITLPTGTSTIGGDFVNSAGSFDANSGRMLFTATDAGNTVTFGGSDAHTVRFAGSGGVWAFGDTNATTTDSFTVTAGSVTLPSGQMVVADDFVILDTMTHNSSELILTKGTGAATVTLSGNDLHSLTVADAATFTMTDAAVALLGDLTVASGTLISATSTLAVGGSLDATGGVVDFASSTVLFNSSDTGETVDPGNNDFYNVSVAGAAGGWTFSSATTTNAFALTSANTFTLGSGETLVVGGVFTNTVGGAATTWTGSTLVLQSGMDFSANTKSAGGDSYNTVELSADTDVRFWDSDFASTVLAASSSIYSQDHSAVAGDLSIFGEFTIATTTEYWSYATDFDGTALGGGSRAVTVSFATTSSSSVTMNSGTLEILGTSGATSTVQSAGAAQYAFTVTGGTLNADQYAFRDLDANGLSLSGAPVVSSLSNGDFEQALNTANLITLTSTALDANASLVVTDTIFNSDGFSGGVNVSLDATTTNSWTFIDHSGDLDGEAYDVDGTDDCSSIRWDDSQCLLTEQTHYRWRNDDGGEGAPDSTWFDTDWGARKRVRVVNDDMTGYTNPAVKLPVVYDADMQTDFDDLRFTDNSGTTTIPYWIERYTTGVSADVWVQVPSLPADTVSEIFMYYDNVTATTTGSSTEVFIAADDFESAGISDYSEDTSLFTVDGSFAYGGGYGLDTTGNEGLRADTGITRFDQTVSQGEIIRYMQYVDTSAGANDESCTLFGVVDPGVDHENYGVCLELFGTDRISLVRDAESTDTYGSVVVLASSTVTYATGWYEVEIDWQTDDTIDVSLYTAAGSLVATTSATDSTYTSGGFGFTYWGFNGGWDSFTSRPRTDTKPGVYFGAEQVDGGATWTTPQDTVGFGFALNETARLRISIENTGLDITDQEFQLEFAEKLTAPSCEAVSGASYGAIPVAGSCGVSDVCMSASSTVTDGDATTDHLIAEGNFTPGEVVGNLSNQTSAFDVDQNEYTEMEYALQLTSYADNDAYCFRVTDDGAALDSYATIAELSLEFAPTLGPVSLNNGSDIALTPGATTTVLATTTVTDFNGYADVVSATTTFYKTSVGALCTANDNNCYIATSSCSFSNCSGNSCDLSCSADFAYHTDPTDTDGGEEWFAFMEVEDSTDLSDFATAPAVEVLTLRALEVDNAIAYGTVDVNSDTGSTTATTTLTNLGNESIDVQVSGTDMTDGSVSIIDVNNQKFATTTFNYSACTACSLLDEIATTVEVDLTKPVSASPATEDYLYWGIFVPFGINSAPHSGLNTFTATGD